jgi:hypothetical protein
MRPAHSRTAALFVVAPQHRGHLRTTGGQTGHPREGDDQMSLVIAIKDALEKRAAYVKTRDEIAAMPRDVALDLDIFPEDAERIAYQAVYGRAA